MDVLLRDTHCLMLVLMKKSMKWIERMQLSDAEHAQHIL